ncbi:hypothetical protein CKO19_02985 [Rhodovulum adriaticum]|nr:hypothetical protein [Rhodovulum adriaticum]
MACLAASLTVTPVTRAAADGSDVVGGIIGGIIGGAIVNEAQRAKSKKKKTVYVSPVSAATRAQNREIQTSLNYFGFPAGVVDGVMGQNSRNAISQYQAFMGYAVTGSLAPYEKDFLVSSYHRAIAGGPATSQMVAASPMGPRGLLKAYQRELATGGAAGMAGGAMGGTMATMPGAAPGMAPPPQSMPSVPVTVPAATPPAAATPPVTTPPAATVPSMPNFMAGGDGPSLASHCNKVSLLTNSNGGFTTLASMSDPAFALSEQFCLARTYAIAEGEDLVRKVAQIQPDEIAAQCEALGPLLKDHVAALSLKSQSEVLRDVSTFVLNAGMAPEQLAGTAKICMSVGYRRDNMTVAIGSGLLLVVLGEKVYAELIGHHLSQGFGTSRRPDLAMAWYDTALTALDSGAVAVFAPGQPERNALIRKAAYSLGGRDSSRAVPSFDNTPKPTALPSFSVEN